MTTLYLFTDGGSYPKDKNGFDATSAFRFYDDKKKFILGEARVYIDKTNQYGELAAIMHGLERIVEYVKAAKLKDFILNIYTDSMYSYKSLTEWIYSWIKNSKNGVFISSKREPVKHQEIIKTAFECLNKLNKQGKVIFHHINSHVSIKNLAKLKKKFEIFNKCKISDEDFIFIYKGNHDCDEDTKVVYQKFKQEKKQIEKEANIDEIKEYCTF